MPAQNSEEFVDIDLLPDDGTADEVPGGGTTEIQSTHDDTLSADQVAHDDDDDDDDEHPSVNTTGKSDADDEGSVDDERQAIRERRRLERQDRKLRAKEREDSLRRELQARDSQLQELRQRLDTIDRRNSTSELGQISAAKDEATRVYNYYKDQIRLGTESNNGTLVAEATEKMMIAGRRYSDLDKIEKAYKQKSSTPPPLNPNVLNNAKNWSANNKWYDPNGRDPDSRIVLTIDQTLAEEGYNPAVPEYWEELSRRVKKYLPHRAKRDNMTHTARQVVAGSGRETSPNKPGSFRLSAERVQALKDLGVWDDPKERDKMIKQYRDYDKSNGNR